MIRQLRYSMVCLGCAFCLSACGGAKPVVTHTDLRPPSAPGQPYVLVVTVNNQSGGEGQAEVTARLVAPATGQTAAQATQNVDLKAHETSDVVLQMYPAASGDYRPDVEVQYPPE